MSIKYVEYEIAGRRLRLLRSVYADKKIAEKYGSAQGFADKLKGEDLMTQMDDALFVLSLLAKAGKANAVLYGEECDSIEPEELEQLITMDTETLTEIFNVITTALKYGKQTDLEIKTEEKATKN